MAEVGIDLVFECIGPLIEVAGYVAVIVLFLAGLLSPEAFGVFLFASVGLGVLLSVNALLLEELSFHLYSRPSQQLRLFVVAIVENFGYRQLTSVWRLLGIFRWVVGLRGRDRRWGRMHRHARWQQDVETVHAPALVEKAAPAAVSRPTEASGA